MCLNDQVWPIPPHSSAIRVTISETLDWVTRMGPRFSILPFYRRSIDKIVGRRRKLSLVDAPSLAAQLVVRNHRRQKWNELANSGVKLVWKKPKLLGKTQTGQSFRLVYQ